MHSLEIDVAMEDKQLSSNTCMRRAVKAVTQYRVRCELASRKLLMIWVINVKVRA